MEPPLSSREKNKVLKTFKKLFNMVSEKIKRKQFEGEMLKAMNIL